MSSGPHLKVILGVQVLQSICTVDLVYSRVKTPLPGAVSEHRPCTRGLDRSLRRNAPEQCQTVSGLNQEQRCQGAVGQQHTCATP